MQAEGAVVSAAEEEGDGSVGTTGEEEAEVARAPNPKGMERLATEK